MACPLLLKVYSSIREEVADVCHEVKNLNALGIKTFVITEAPSVRSAIYAELQYQQIAFKNEVSSSTDCQIDEFWRTILNDWISWQTTRGIGPFARFVSDLNILDILSSDQVSDLNKILTKFSGGYLTDQYDIFRPFLPKEFEAIIDRFDFGTDAITAKNFLKKYKQIWSKIGDEHILALEKLFISHEQDVEFPISALLADLACFLSNSSSIDDHCDDSVQILSVVDYSSTSYAQIDDRRIFYYIWSDMTKDGASKNFLSQLFKQENFSIACLETEANNCTSYLSDIFGATPTVKTAQSSLTLSSCATQNLSDVYQTEIAYDSRHDSDKKFDHYSYMIDIETDRSYPCKIVESFLKNPQNVFYKNVLLSKNFSEIEIKSLKKIFIGTVVHDLLDISPNHCSECPEIEKFNKLIDRKFEIFTAKIRETFGDKAINHHLRESLNVGKFTAYKLAKQIVSYGLRYITTEFSLPRDSEVNFGKKTVKLNGRVDCILSEKEFSIDHPDDSSTLNIFDFKTGTYELLNSEKLPKQLEDYVGVQILLYGMIFQKLGFRNVNIQIICPDKKITQPVRVDDVISQCGWLLEKLEAIFTSGIIGENTHSFIDLVNNDLPISESLIDNKIIALKRQLTRKII